MSQEDEISEVVEQFEMLKEDGGVPRNIKLKIDLMISALKEQVDVSIRVNKVLTELDEISEDVNLQSFMRTQIWNIVSMLEKI